MHRKRNLRSLTGIVVIVLILLSSITIGASAKSTARVAADPAPGFVVIPPDAEVRGYSLAEAAAATALFNATYDPTRDPSLIPEDFPFQVLYITEDNTFTVKPGTMFYLPLVWSDDTDGAFWPFPDVTDPAAVSAYYFDPLQLGTDTARIVVDGRVTDLGPEYAAGAVAPFVLDTGGRYYTVLAAFLPPLPKGTHTVMFAINLSGKFLVDAFGGGFGGEFTYTVIVE